MDNVTSQNLTSLLRDLELADTARMGALIRNEGLSELYDALVDVNDTVKTMLEILEEAQ